MKGFFVRLREYYSFASNTQKAIIDYILKSPEDVLGVSIYELAKKTFSSASTITRLCHDTGFEKYKEFQNALLYEMVLVNEMDSKVALEAISKDDSLKSIADKVTMNNIKSLEDTRKLIDLEILEKCSHLIQTAKSIGFFGLGASLLVAKDAYLKFLRVNKACSICDDWHAQFLQASNMTEHDLAVIFSYSGITEEMLKCATRARDRDVPIIAVTGFRDSPLSDMADYNLYVGSIEHIIRSGAMSSRIAQLNMVDILYTKFINDNYDQSIGQLKKTHIVKAKEEE